MQILVLTYCHARMWSCVVIRPYHNFCETTNVTSTRVPFLIQNMCKTVCNIYKMPRDSDPAADTTMNAVPLKGNVKGCVFVVISARLTKKKKGILRQASCLVCSNYITRIPYSANHVSANLIMVIAFLIFELVYNKAISKNSW